MSLERGRGIVGWKSSYWICKIDSNSCSILTVMFSPMEIWREFSDFEHIMCTHAMRLFFVCLIWFQWFYWLPVLRLVALKFRQSDQISADFQCSDLSRTKFGAQISGTLLIWGRKNRQMRRSVMKTGPTSYKSMSLLLLLLRLYQKAEAGRIMLHKNRHFIWQISQIKREKNLLKLHFQFWWARLLKYKRESFLFLATPIGRFLCSDWF